MKNHPLQLILVQTSQMCLPIVLLTLSAHIHAGGRSDLTELGFDQLMNLEVSTVSRKPQSLSKTAAAAYIITRDEIRRSGASSIPEALRLAPGVQVAQLNSGLWSVSIRGFSGRFANKLLVLIDGRNIYSPAFAGTYWEMEDIPLSDIERIEVIRGPGGTLWGANAVNGIVNVITRRPDQTQHHELNISKGDKYSQTSAHFGGRLAEKGAFRAYVKGTEGEEFQAADGFHAHDDYHRQQIGFRTDWLATDRDQFSIHGDYLKLAQGQPLNVPDSSFPNARRLYFDDVSAKNTNLVMRWEHTQSVDSEYSLQAYINHSDRKEFIWGETHLTFDLDFQHHIAPSLRNDLIWGLGYRQEQDRFDVNREFVEIQPEKMHYGIYSGFIQHEYAIDPNHLWLTIGTKVENSELNGTEWQPSMRLLWTPNAKHSLWSSLSRAVRTPGRGEKTANIYNFILPPYQPPNLGPLPLKLHQLGTSSFDSEKLVALEAGWRFQPTETFSMDTTIFNHWYDDLRMGQPLQPVISMTEITVPMLLLNNEYGRVWGAEFYADWRPNREWRFQLGWSLAKAELKLQSMNPFGIDNSSVDEGNTPEQTFSLRGSWSPRHDLDLDLWFRATGATPFAGEISGLQGYDVNAYTSFDARIAWRPKPGVEVSLTGKNLFNSGHLEGISEYYAVPTEIPRQILAGITLEF